MQLQEMAQLEAQKAIEKAVLRNDVASLEYMAQRMPESVTLYVDKKLEAIKLEPEAQQLETFKSILKILNNNTEFPEGMSLKRQIHEISKKENREDLIAQLNEQYKSLKVFAKEGRLPELKNELDKEQAKKSAYSEKINDRMDHYQILGVKRDATQEQIQEAYQDLKVLFQGDKKYKGIGEIITAAYRELKDPEKPREYDSNLEKPKAPISISAEKMKENFQARGASPVSVAVGSPRESSQGRRGIS